MAKYDLSEMPAASRSSALSDLTRLGINHVFSDDILRVGVEDESATEQVLAKWEAVEAVFEEAQTEARLERHGLLAPACELCGTRPAARLELRRQTGMVVVMTSYRTELVLCLRCGEAAFKEFQKQTAIKGWTGVRSALTNPFVLGANASQIRKFRDEIARLSRRS